jgi:energy-coupling factor transport system ATP-binding protein
MPITLDDVSFVYPDGSSAVESVSFAVADGERAAILGQNGAGKTTTVKMMNGLLKPTSGVVTVDGVATTGRSTASVAKDVSYVFQNPDDQISASSVRDELWRMPKYLKWDVGETETRVARAAELTGISDHLDTNPNDLPFAIKKFVAIASTLVSRCRYAIFDEPTAGLDHHGIGLLNHLLDQLQDEGVGVVTITHDMRFVVESFDRVIVMANKRLIADGRATDVFADDATLRTARLKRPEASQLAVDLGVVGSPLRLASIAEALA